MFKQRAGAAICAAVFAQTMTAPAMAAPIVIHRLGTAPVLGALQSTGELQQAVRTHAQTFHQASLLIGLSEEQYRQLVANIEAGKLRYVTVPQHLERTTWAGGGPVHVLDDVVIPAGTRGWEIDLRHGRTIAQVFIPAICGNVSIVHRRLPAPLAARKVRPVPVPTPVPTATPVPLVTPPPAVVQSPPPATIVQAHHPNAVLPLLGLIGLFLLIPRGNNSPPPLIPTPPPCIDP